MYLSTTEPEELFVFPCLVFQISKELVEEKIQTNKMREQFEEETFELKNRVRVCLNKKWVKLNLCLISITIR